MPACAPLFLDLVLILILFVSFDLNSKSNFHHYYFILSGKVFVPQYLKTAQAVLVNPIYGHFNVQRFPTLQTFIIQAPGKGTIKTQFVTLVLIPPHVHLCSGQIRIRFRKCARLHQQRDVQREDPSTQLFCLLPTEEDIRRLQQGHCHFAGFVKLIFIFINFLSIPGFLEKA